MAKLCYFNQDNPAHISLRSGIYSVFAGVYYRSVICVTDDSLSGAVVMAVTSANDSSSISSRRRLNYCSINADVSCLSSEHA